MKRVLVKVTQEDIDSFSLSFSCARNPIAKALSRAVGRPVSTKMSLVQDRKTHDIIGSLPHHAADAVWNWRDWCLKNNPPKDVSQAERKMWNKGRKPTPFSFFWPSTRTLVYQKKDGTWWNARYTEKGIKFINMLPRVEK